MKCLRQQEFRGTEANPIKEISIVALSSLHAYLGKLFGVSVSLHLLFHA